MLQGLEETIGSSFNVFIGGKQVDGKMKIQKLLKTTEFKMVMFGLGSVGGAAKPSGVRWWSRFPVHQKEGDD